MALARCIAVSAAAHAILDGLFADGERASRSRPGRPAGSQRRPTTTSTTSPLAGFLTFADRPKADAAASIAKLTGSAWW